MVDKPVISSIKSAQKQGNAGTFISDYTFERKLTDQACQHQIERRCIPESPKRAINVKMCAQASTDHP